MLKIEISTKFITLCGEPFDTPPFGCFSASVALSPPLVFVSLSLTFAFHHNTTYRAEEEKAKNILLFIQVINIYKMTKKHK